MAAPWHHFRKAAKRREQEEAERQAREEAERRAREEAERRARREWVWVAARLAVTAWDIVESILRDHGFRWPWGGPGRLL